MVGQNLQQLEVSEEKALQREENYQNQLKSLSDSLKVSNLIFIFFPSEIEWEFNWDSLLGSRESRGERGDEHPEAKHKDRPGSIEKLFYRWKCF